MGKSVPSRPSVRNLQAIKGGSYTITLPRWWVLKQRLRKGSKLFMSEDGAALKIVARDVIGKRRRVEIDLDKLGNMRSVRYAIWTYYMQGADEIVVRSSEPLAADRKRQLREVRMDLPGIDIAREDDRTVVFIVSEQQEEKKLDDMITSLHNVALTIHRDAVKALVEGNVEAAAEVVSREPEVLRIYRSIIRHIAQCSMNPETAYRSGVSNTRELLTYAVFARDLSRLIYHAMYVARHFNRYGRKIEDTDMLRLIEMLSEQVYRMQSLAVESFLEKNFNKVLHVTDMMVEVKGLEESINVRTLQSVSDVDKAVTLMMIVREMRRMAGHCVAIADIAANRMLAPDEEIMLVRTNV